jgi:hypothetical protein
MAAPDLNSLGQDISAKISSAKTAVESLKNEKDLKKSAANSSSQGLNQITSQLDKIKDLQKRYQREPPNSMDKLLGFLGQTSGQGSSTVKYLRKKILEASVQIEPKVSVILKEQSMKALGCSQEQSYKGVTPKSLELQPLPLRPIGPNDNSVYIPVQSVDLFSNLKNSPETSFGKVWYENPEPSANTQFKPFGGDVSFPMNKQLYQIMDSSNTGRSLSQILGQNYQGKSGQNLFDIQYTKTNEFGVSGDYYRVMLIDRTNADSGTTIVNKVGEFISDYYSTINLVDSVDIGAQLVNILSGAININAKIGFGELQNQSQFSLIVQRILGLCFDNRREIDVSGIAKIAELDGVDDTFFELNEIDLRNIDQKISNIQNGVMEFEDCDNVKVPVDSDSIVNQLIQFRNSLSAQTNEQKVQTLETIIDSISQNPEWKLKLPSTFSANLAIDQDIIKKISLAVVACVLTPKNLLPVFTLLSVIQSGATYTYNQAVTSANTYINSANTVNSQGSNIINDGKDFLKKWKTFSIESISKINAVFLEVLFDILKKDLINLISSIVKDIEKSKALKKYAIILRLVGLAIAVAQLIKDYRQCKPLLEDILAILLLINSTGIGKKLGLGGKNEIPISLLLLTKLLPGFSPERAFINVIEELQGLGIPTGALPDGSPNLMLLYNLATHKGSDKEKSENGKLDAVGVSPIAGIVEIFGKDV